MVRGTFEGSGYGGQSLEGLMGNPYIFCISDNTLQKYIEYFKKQFIFRAEVRGLAFFLSTSQLKYHKIVLKHLPFTLHIFVKATPMAIARKLNGIKLKSTKFEKSDFEMSASSVASTYDLEYSLPGHYLIHFHHTDLNTIAHEVFHVVMWHNKYIGQKFNNGSEESYAYLFGYLISEIDEFIKGHN